MIKLVSAGPSRHRWMRKTGRLIPCSALLVMFMFSAAADIAAASPDDARAGSSESFFSCKRGYDGIADLAQAKETTNFYNGLLYFGATAGLNFGTDPSNRWSSTNGFDTGIRDGLRLDSRSARDDARIASDVALVFSAALLPIAGITARFARTHDCVEAWDMAGKAFESLALTLLVTESVKLISGRERPFGRDCDGTAPGDARCGSRSRRLSFFSGHASLAAAGAGIACSQAISHDAWGTSRRAKVAPCALGIGAALAAGALRVAADKHWGSDVLIGFAVGGLVGYFDTWGPFDLLKFSTRDSAGRISSRGIVLPKMQNGVFGAQLVMVF